MRVILTSTVPILLKRHSRLSQKLAITHVCVNAIKVRIPFKFMSKQAMDDIIIFPEMYHFRPGNYFAPTRRMIVKTNSKESVAISHRVQTVHTRQSPGKTLQL